METTFHELTCSGCKQQYNMEDKTPHMIPSCGHTICKACLTQKLEALTENESLECLEDNIKCPFGREVKLFPLNQSIFKMIRQQDYKEKSQNTLSQDLQPSNQNLVGSFCQEKDPIQKIPIITSFSELIQDDDLTEQTPDYKFICREHKRRLELVCMNDYQYICVTCALFGVHKNHNFRPLEEVFIELDNKINETVELIQILGQKQELLNQHAQDEKALNSYYDQLTVRDQKVIQDKVDILLSEINKKKNILLEDIAQKHKIEKEAYKLQQVAKIKQLSDSADQWKRDAKLKLMVLTQRTDACEIPQEIFREHLQHQDQNVIGKGKLIIYSIDEYVNDFEVTYPKGRFEFNITGNYLDYVVQNLNITQHAFIPKLSIMQGEFLPQQVIQKHDESILKDQLYVDTSRFHLEQDNSKIELELDLTSDQTTQSVQEQFTQNLVNNFRRKSETQVQQNEFIQSLQRNQTEPEDADNQSNLGSQRNVMFPQFIESLQSYEHLSSGHNQTHSMIPTDINTENHSPVTQPQVLLNKRRSQTFVANDANEQLQVPQKTLIQSTSRKSIFKLNKNIKINEKIEQQINQIKEDKQDLVDILQLGLIKQQLVELNDDACTMIAQLMKGSQNIKVLKLMKDKITDEGAIKILNSIEFTNLQSLHLQNNCLTDRTLDHFVVMIRKKSQKNELPTLKAIYLNQNQINCVKNKKKVEEIKKLGITITI